MRKFMLFFFCLCFEIYFYKVYVLCVGDRVFNECEGICFCFGVYSFDNWGEKSFVGEVYCVRELG